MENTIDNNIKKIQTRLRESKTKSICICENCKTKLINLINSNDNSNDDNTIIYINKDYYIYKLPHDNFNGRCKLFLTSKCENGVTNCVVYVSVKNEISSMKEHPL